MRLKVTLNIANHVHLYKLDTDLPTVFTLAGGLFTRGFRAKRRSVDVLE